MSSLSAAESALVEVGHWLRASGYEFITVTPESHRRVNARANAAKAGSIRDVFGWSRPFETELLPRDVLRALREADAVERVGEMMRAKVRFSTCGVSLFVHSAYPTDDEQAVFFGPDTYRFCSFIARQVKSAERVLDVGCGSGAGGLSLADRAARIVLSDVNALALSHARVNSELAGVADCVTLVQSNLYAEIEGSFDLIVANPPYMVDGARRAYRDGGGELGTGLALRMVREGLARLASGGRFLLYTGAPIVGGADPVRGALSQLGAPYTYEELDPDVFGEELDTEAYAGVDRIAAIGAVIRP